MTRYIVRYRGCQITFLLKVPNMQVGELRTSCLANEIQNCKSSLSLADAGPDLLFVVLNNFGGPLFRFIRIFAELLERPALPQQIPILVELHF